MWFRSSSPSIIADLMATAQTFQETISAPKSCPEDNNACFDCNICLDSVHDPVVTLCGHLFCWPCIYKWIHLQTPSSPQSEHQPQCPVCKASISNSSLVPLYGRGTSSSISKPNKPQLSLVIPRRPASDPNQRSIQDHRYLTESHGNLISEQFSHMGDFQSYSPRTNGMFREMVYARIFGSTEMNLYAYPDTYPLVWSSAPRMRRQEVQIDNSLNRISIFCFCFILLCLLLF